MSLKSNAGTGEYSSPFYKKNKLFCEEFETFIKEIGGTTNGLYNAWSYNVLGKFNNKSNWQFRIKKSTYSSGNLILSSKYQNLHIISEFEAKTLESNFPNFQIKKKEIMDFLKFPLFNKWTNIVGINKYIIKSSEPENSLIININRILKDYYLKETVLSIIYENSNLKIIIQTDKILKKEIQKMMEI